MQTWVLVIEPAERVDLPVVHPCTRPEPIVCATQGLPLALGRVVDAGGKGLVHIRAPTADDQHKLLEADSNVLETRFGGGCC